MPGRDALPGVRAEGAHLHVHAAHFRRRQGGAVLALQPFGALPGAAQQPRQILRQVRTAQRERGGVGHGPLVVHADGGCAPSDIDRRHALRALLGRDRARGGGKGCEHDLIHLHARVLHALRQVLHGRHRARHDVGLRVEAGAEHPHRVGNRVGAFDPVPPRDDVEDLTVGGDADLPRHLNGARPVVRRDRLAAVGDGHDAAVVLRAQVPARDTHDPAEDAHPARLLCLLHRRCDGIAGRLDVVDHPACEAGGGRHPNAEYVRLPVLIPVGDERRHLRGADVDGCYGVTLLHGSPR